MLHQEEDLAQGLSDDSESDDSKLLREKWTLSSKRLFDENLVVFKCSQLSDDLSWEDKNEEWEKREATGRQVWLLFVSCSRSEIGKEEKETFLKLSSPGVTIEMFFLFFNCLQERNLSLSNPLQDSVKYVKEIKWDEEELQWMGEEEQKRDEVMGKLAQKQLEFEWEDLLTLGLSLPPRSLSLSLPPRSLFLCRVELRTRSMRCSLSLVSKLSLSLSRWEGNETASNYFISLHRVGGLWNGMAHPKTYANSERTMMRWAN